MSMFQRFTVFAWAVLAMKTAACNVPVFRYALERWPADLYRVTVFHRGAMSVEQQAVVDLLRRASDDGLVNIDLALADVAGELPGRAERLWKAETNPELPLVAVQYPAVTGQETLAARGPLAAAFAQQLLDSPARSAVRQRILQGDSIVWLLLESGDPERDDDAVELLEAESEKLAKLLELPPVDPGDPRTDGNVRLKIAFSVVRLSGKDAAERIWVSQLVNSHPRFAEVQGPIVFPVFGRGRALCGLAEAELTAENVEEIAVFLTGACSCEVKAMNPGVDLLLAADWDALIEGRAVKEPELPTLAGLSQVAAETQVMTATAPIPSPQSHPTVLTRSLVVVIGLGLVTMVASTLWLRRRG